MRTSERYDGGRYARALHVVMWLDAFWSVVAVLVSLVGALAVGLLGMPHELDLVVGVAAIVAGAFLAACGVVTGVLLMLRLNAGFYAMPRMHVPLPPGMHGDIG